jgi:hypothetical protein
LNDSSSRIANLELPAPIGGGFQNRHPGTRWTSDHHAATTAGRSEQFRACFAFLIRDFDAPAAWSATRKANTAAIADAKFSARASGDEACGQRVACAPEDSQCGLGAVIVCTESRHRLDASQRDASVWPVEMNSFHGEAVGRLSPGLSGRGHQPGRDGDQGHGENVRPNALVLLTKTGDFFFQSSDDITRVHACSYL